MRLPKELHNDVSLDWSQVAAPSIHIAIEFGADPNGKNPAMLNICLNSQETLHFLRDGLRFDKLFGERDLFLAADCASELIIDLVQDLARSCNLDAYISHPSHIDDIAERRRSLTSWAKNPDRAPSLHFFFSARFADRTAKCQTPAASQFKSRLKRIFAGFAGQPAKAADHSMKTPPRGFCLSLGFHEAGAPRSAFFGLNAQHWDAWIRTHPMFATLTPWDAAAIWTRQAPLARLGFNKSSWCSNPLCRSPLLREDPRSSELFPFASMGTYEQHATQELLLCAAQTLFSTETLPFEYSLLSRRQSWTPEPDEDEKAALAYFECFDVLQQRQEVDNACASANRCFQKPKGI